MRSSPIHVSAVELEAALVNHGLERLTGHHQYDQFAVHGACRAAQRIDPDGPDTFARLQLRHGAR
jgi:hypothetical protein